LLIVSKQDDFNNILFCSFISIKEYKRYGQHIQVTIGAAPVELGEENQEERYQLIYG